MSIQEKVRYEEMLPHEIVGARKEFPVAYLALGGVEWHGPHLEAGNDTLKAHALCVIAARKGGRLAMPPLFGGKPASSKSSNLDTTRMDAWRRRWVWINPPSQRDTWTSL